MSAGNLMGIHDGGVIVLELSRPTSDGGGARYFTLQMLIAQDRTDYGRHYFCEVKWYYLLIRITIYDDSRRTW